MVFEFMKLIFVQLHRNMYNMLVAKDTETKRMKSNIPLHMLFCFPPQE